MRGTSDKAGTSGARQESGAPAAAPLRRRRAGILLHPTSLPGPYGIGDLGPSAEAFLRWAAEAGQGLWLVLPLRPTGWGDSPYGSLSSFAGNPLLIAPDALAADGLASSADLARLPRDGGGRVDFAAARGAKEALLRAAFESFRRDALPELARAHEAFVAEARTWLADWCLFAALKQRFAGTPWTAWPPEIRRREAGALAAAEEELSSEVAFHRFVQFLFFRQWDRLRRLACELDIEVIGDLPIYVPLDSADVWVRPDLFDLDAEGRPVAVSGVPPDAFSADGQRWGSPLYRWQRHSEEGYAWWVERVRSSLRLADVVRLDHFRGFEAYWRVPAGEKTAAGGSWVPGPGAALLDALRRGLGGLPLVAEDLGFITPGVGALLAATALPGMKVLQFAFSEPDSEHLPHHHRPNAVVFTGTHDNDTACGWFAHAGPEEQRRALDYLGAADGSEIAWAMIRAAHTSVAERAVVPLQDVLSLGSEARMNTPGRSSGNWAWRVREEQIASGIAARLRRLAEVSGRLARPPKAEAAAAAAGDAPLAAGRDPAGGGP
jgi:4-alpha-glucanotransferase